MAKIKLQCQIKDIERIPGSEAHLVSIEFTLGLRVWHKAFRVHYDRPISMEEFIHNLSLLDVLPADLDDNLAYVKEEANEPFELEVERPSKKEA